MLKPAQCVLFDLDGTLADTAPDLAYALNQTLLHYGQKALDFEEIRPVVSHGGIALIRLGFGMQPDEQGFEERRQHLLKIYEENIHRHTCLFPEMDVVLDNLEDSGTPWGIVTNKPSWLTNPLMESMGITSRTNAIVSSDTCKNRKPHPEPIEYACKLLEVDPTKTWYVGDAGRDMEAGRAAGNTTIGASYGYIYPDDPIASWDYDALIAKPSDLLTLIEQANNCV